LRRFSFPILPLEEPLVVSGDLGGRRAQQWSSKVHSADRFTRVESGASFWRTNPFIGKVTTGTGCGSGERELVLAFGLARPAQERAVLPAGAIASPPSGGSDV
jgi:hypothetical protein